MASISEEVTFPLQCPKCGHKFEESVARLKNNPSIKCPSCGHEFEHRDQLSAGDAFDQIDDLSRAWDKLSKK